MKEENSVKDKSLAFGVRITKMVRHLIKNNPLATHSIFNQVLKSGTSIGANICEANFAESKSDFKHKLKIALKEASETEYWLKILHKGEFITEPEYKSIITDCHEIIKLLTASINTLNKSN